MFIQHLIQLHSMHEIVKKYHFHSAHRNLGLGKESKCSNIHGHTYRIEVCFDANYSEDDRVRKGLNFSFEQLDQSVDPIIKDLDHCFILQDTDPLVPILKGHSRLYLLDFPSSAENLASHILNRIKEVSKVPVLWLTLAETTSSVVKVQ